MAAGLRVLRGPDWDRGEADGGEGHLGTVVEVKDDKTVEVVWDSGDKTTCRIGREGKHDLRVVDNAPIGVRHDDVACDGCGERRIQGMRWHCMDCPDYDLCSVCYVTGKHELTHQFIRFTFPDSNSEMVDKRNKSMKVRALGIFPGATVARGRDWAAGNVDGGPGKTGRVTELVSPELRSPRSAVKVFWTTGITEVHRVAQDGKIDLKYVEEAPGVDYYPTHLPALDFDVFKASQFGSEGEAKSAPDDVEIRTGDKVCVEIDAETLRDIQKARGGWSTGMSQCIGKIGTVTSISLSGDADVDFGDTKWRLFPGALRKVASFKVGDIVRVLSEEKRVATLQDGHGDWNDDMKSCLGKIGRVVKMDSDGDLAVAFGRRTWLLNPACCVPAPGCSVDSISNQIGALLDEKGGNSDDGDDASISDLFSRLGSDGEGLQILAGMALLEALREHVEQSQGDLGFVPLVKAITAGNLREVRQIIQKCPELVNTTQRGLTALHIASHEGQSAIVQFLVEKGAELNKQDNDGDTPLLVALGRKHVPVAEYLANRGADGAVTNKKSQTAVHYAAYLGNPSVLKILIAKGCNVNMQDSDKDTPLHDAIEKDNPECVEVLMTSPKIDIRTVNKRGLNPLHFAALKGNARATEKIVTKNQSTVNLKKEDGFTPLHIAAFNDHTDVIRVLVQRGKADVNIKTNKGQTPLHLSCEEAYYPAAVKLVEFNADVLAKDNDDNTPLHAVLEGERAGVFLRLLIGQRPRNDKEFRVRIACYLLQHGADVAVKNKAGKTPLDVTKDSEIRDAVKRFVQSNPKLLTPTKTTPTTTPMEQTSQSSETTVKCSRCNRNKANVVVLPCAHKDVCIKCCPNIKTCTVCRRPITAKVDESGKKLDDKCVIQ